MNWLIGILSCLVLCWLLCKLGRACPKCKGRWTWSFSWWSEERRVISNLRCRNDERTVIDKVPHPSVKCYGCGYDGPSWISLQKATRRRKNSAAFFIFRGKENPSTHKNAQSTTITVLPTAPKDIGARHALRKGESDSFLKAKSFL